MKTPDAHRSTKHAKAERRARRGAKTNRRGSGWTVTSPPNPLDQIVLDALKNGSGFDQDRGWDGVSSSVLPLLKRVRHAYPKAAAPVHLLVPPGVWVGFGVDLGPAWAHVSLDLVTRWGVDETTILGAALDNLRARMLVDPPVVEPANFAGVPATVVQAQGYGSALIFAPDRLAPLIGSTRQTILTPIRNALIALPEDVDEDLAIAIWEAFAEEAQDELDIDPLLWTGTSVTSFSEPADLLPN